jgi:hypothetical protein
VGVRRYRGPPAPGAGCQLAAACAQNPQAGRTVGRGEREEAGEALRARLEGEEAKALDQPRKQTAEWVNADWKAHRRLRRFRGRGRERARCPVGLRVRSQKLRTLLALEKTGPAARPAP